MLVRSSEVASEMSVEEHRLEEPIEMTHAMYLGLERKIVRCRGGIDGSQSWHRAAVPDCELVITFQRCMKKLTGQQ
jgi:hypothetical protein